MPEGLRVDAGAHLAGDDLFAVAGGGARAATSEASIDLRPGGEDGGAQVAALLPCDNTVTRTSTTTTPWRV